MKNKLFTAATLSLSLLLILPNVFTFCSTTRYAEQPPSFSNTKLSEWSKIRTTDFESVVKTLDSLLTKEAKTYYASLEEPYAAVVMQRSFGNTINMDWNIKEGEIDFYKKNYTSGFLNLFSPSGFPYQPIKNKVICICYYRHLNNQPYNFVAVKDSLKNLYPFKKDLLGISVDLTKLYNDEDSITNSYYFKTWQIGDYVKNGFYYEARSAKKSISGTCTGTIINKDSQSQMLEIRITDIEVNDKKVLAYVDPKSNLEIYAIGNTIFKKPQSLTNLNRKEPFRY